VTLLIPNLWYNTYLTKNRRVLSMSRKSTGKWKEMFNFKPGRKGMTFEERLWEKIKKVGDDECWEWVGTRTRDGYGMIKGKTKKIVPAHRMVYEQVKGPIPAGLVIMHTCDNPGCCNPAHLVPGTVNDNNQDKIVKGRTIGLPGELNPFVRLTEDKVRAIRQERKANGTSLNKIALQFGISKKQVLNIVHRRQWGWLE
jgi:hypothetical protein